MDKESTPGTIPLLPSGALFSTSWRTPWRLQEWTRNQPDTCVTRSHKFDEEPKHRSREDLAADLGWSSEELEHVQAPRAIALWGGGGGYRGAAGGLLLKGVLFLVLHVFSSVDSWSSRVLRCFPSCSICFPCFKWFLLLSIGLLRDSLIPK